MLAEHGRLVKQTESRLRFKTKTKTQKTYL